MNDNDDLETFRASIDRIDNALCALLAERFAVTQKVGEYKARMGLPAVDASREEKQFKKITMLAEQYGLDPQFATRFLRLTIDEVVKNHEKLMAAHATKKEI